MNRRTVTVNPAEQLRLREIALREDADRRAANLDILRREGEQNQALLEIERRIEEPMEFEEPMDVEELMEEGPREIALREDETRRAANLGILRREEEERNQQNQLNQALLEIEPRNVAPMIEGGKRKKKSKKAKKAKKSKKAKKGKKAKKTKNLRRHAVKQTRRHRR